MRWFFNFWRLARWPAKHDEHDWGHDRSFDCRRFLFRQLWKKLRIFWAAWTYPINRCIHIKQIAKERKASKHLGSLSHRTTRRRNFLCSHEKVLSTWNIGDLILICRPCLLFTFFFLRIFGRMPFLFRKSLSGSKSYHLSAAILCGFWGGRPGFPVFTVIISSNGPACFLLYFSAWAEYADSSIPSASTRRCIKMPFPLYSISDLSSSSFPSWKKNRQLLLNSSRSTHHSNQDRAVSLWSHWASRHDAHCGPRGRSRHLHPTIRIYSSEFKILRDGAAGRPRPPGFSEEKIFLNTSHATSVSPSNLPAINPPQNAKGLL